MTTRRTELQRALRAGFTLIEVMIVVAIIGILAALAIPQYQDYVVKSQISRALWEASAYKIPVEERMHNGVFVFPDPAGTLGYIRSSLTSTPNTFTFNADGSGAIVVLLNGDVHSAVTGTRITVARRATGDWTCAVRGGSADFKPSLLPQGCTLDTGS